MRAASRYPTGRYRVFFDGLRAKTIVVLYRLDGPDATSLHKDTIDHPPLIRGTRAEVLASIGRYQPPRKKPEIPPSSMRIPCEDHGHEAPYDSAHREKNRLPDLGNIIQLEGRARSVAHSILRTVLPLSLHPFCLYRLVNCCRKTDSAVIVSRFSSGRLSQVHHLTHPRRLAPCPTGSQITAALRRTPLIIACSTTQHPSRLNRYEMIRTERD